MYSGRKRKAAKPTANVPEVPDSLDLVRRELLLNGLEVPKIPGVAETAILTEIDHALRPDVHEQRVPPYGVILSPTDLGSLDATQKVSTQPLGKFARQAADGRRSFVVYSGGGIGLWRFSGGFEDERQLIEVANSAHALVVKRRENGMVTIIWDDHSYTVQHRRWLVRMPIDTMWKSVAQVCSAPVSLTKAILRLCCYIFSPRGVGTTLVWYLKEPTHAEASLWQAPNLADLALDVEDVDDSAEILHLGRYFDGAFLLAPEGTVRRLGGHLGYSAETAQLVPGYRGTRHTSAKRYSYEHANTIVFVVSQDGDVSVFSDGARVADSPLIEAGQEARFLRSIAPQKGRDVHAYQQVVDCTRCGKQLRVETTVVVGWKELETVNCPVCGNESVYSSMCWSLQAFPMKKLT
jgi:hypothetical protein